MPPDGWPKDMDILAHRGLWKRPGSQNTLRAFTDALDSGLGIEFDVRDRDGKLVIAHDLPGKDAPLVRDVFNVLSRHTCFRRVRYALNVKSDGLERAIGDFIARFGLRRRCFAFDMSGPQLFSFCAKRTPVALATRYSDVEQPVLLNKVPWVWLDEMRDAWITPSVITKLVRLGKMVAVVSPELHGRPYHAAWRRYRMLPSGVSGSVALCTDHAVEAAAFFAGKRV